MERIQNLTELKKHASKDDIKHIFTEYLLEEVGKAEKLEEIEKIVHKNGSIEDIKGIL